MKDLLFSLIAGTSGFASYALVFLVLLAAGFGLPLPEDIPLLAGGIAAYHGKANLLVMMVVGYVGIILGDSAMFMLGRRIGSKSPSRGPFARLMTAEKRARVEQLFKKHGEKIVMVARFLPGVRAVTYFTAGSVGMKYSHFIFYDSVAALLSAPLFVYLGYYFGADIDAVFGAIARGERGVIVGVIALAVIAVVVGRVRARREARKNAEALEQQRQLDAAAPRVGEQAP